MYVAVDKALLVQELKALNHLLEGVEDFDGAHAALGVGLPLGQDGGALHLNKNELVRDHPVVVDVDQVFVFELSELLDDEDGLAPLASVKRADVDAGHHALAFLVFNDENLSVALLAVKTLNHVGVVHRVADLLLGLLCLRGVHAHPLVWGHRLHHRRHELHGRLLVVHRRIRVELRMLLVIRAGVLRRWLLVLHGSLVMRRSILKFILLAVVDAGRYLLGLNSVHMRLFELWEVSELLILISRHFLLIRLLSLVMSGLHSHHIMLLQLHLLALLLLLLLLQQLKMFDVDVDLGQQHALVAETRARFGSEDFGHVLVRTHRVLFLLSEDWRIVEGGLLKNNARGFKHLKLLSFF